MSRIHGIATLVVVVALVIAAIVPSRADPLDDARLRAAGLTGTRGG